MESVAADSQVFVFAYGSNLCTPRMRARVPSAVPVTSGYVPQRRFVFHKRSVDGSAKADALFVAGSEERIWGCVYRMDRRHKRLLDDCEFLGIGYDEELVNVVQSNGTARAWMYVARSNAIDSTLLPYSWYRELIISGAIEHGLPAQYVEHLGSHPAADDPDPGRHSANIRLIDGRRRNRTSDQETANGR